MKAFYSILFLATVTPALSDHHVALVIGEENSAPGLEDLGYRCQVSPMLPDKELRGLLGDWSARTPTNSTALIHFRGAVQQEGGRLSLVAENGRPVAVADVFDWMSGRGGSTTNLLALDSPIPADGAERWPAGCHIITVGEADLAPATQPSRAIAPPDQFRQGERGGEEWVNQSGMVFCWIPPGSFTAGSPEDAPGRHDDETPRTLTIRDGFWIGKYEHTRGQALRNLNRHSVGSDKNHPVEMLHWDDARAMLRKLTADERAAGRLPEDWEYTLPSEDEWEFAARAGSSTLYSFGDEVDALPRHGNFADKSFYESGHVHSQRAHRTLDDGFAGLAPVGSFEPNPWGLHDVHGNVTEWCRDHGARGGSWVSLAETCRSAYRDHYSSRDEQIYLGYRFVIRPVVSEEYEARSAAPPR